MAPKALQRRVTGRSRSLWIQIEGSPRPIELEMSSLKNVDSLLKVKEVSPQLDKVPVNFLQLFPNKTATQALEPDLRVSGLTGGSDAKEALRVKPVILEQAVGTGGRFSLGLSETY